MASEKQTAANQQNGKLGTGPKDTSQTRYNAIKHALTSRGLTELDDAEYYQRVLEDLIKKFRPVGEVENALIRSAALDLIRAERAQRLAAEQIEASLNPLVREKSNSEDLIEMFEGRVVDPGFPMAIDPAALPMLQLFQRYESQYRAQFRSSMRSLQFVHDLRKRERMPGVTPAESMGKTTGRHAAHPALSQQSTSLSITAGRLMAVSADVTGPQHLTITGPDMNNHPPIAEVGEASVVDPGPKPDTQQPKNLPEALWNTAPPKPFWQ